MLDWYLPKYLCPFLQTTSVEGEGNITAIRNSEIKVDGQTLIYTSSTVIKYNDVSSFAVGLAIQYKGNLDENGDIIATDLEVN